MGLCGGVALLPHSKRVRIPAWAFLCGVCMFSGFLPLPKNIHVRLIGVSKIDPRSECEFGWFSVWPCDGLATCPGCTPTLAQ